MVLRSIVTIVRVVKDTLTGGVPLLENAHGREEESGERGARCVGCDVDHLVRLKLSHNNQGCGLKRKLQACSYGDEPQRDD